MGIEDFSPDDVVLAEWGFVKLNLTIVNTWLVMALLAGASWRITRNLSTGPRLSWRQNVLEIIVNAIVDQIHEVSQQPARRYVALIGTLFLFVAASNLLAVVPGFDPPTASLSTTAALALCVLASVPIYGIAHQGVGGYLRQYFQPTPFMFPFNVIGEFSRTLALAVRLFGNMMSGVKIAAILLAIAPLFVPLVAHVLGLLTGLIQAYIFAILALVYIASATQAHAAASDRTSQPGEPHHG